MVTRYGIRVERDGSYLYWFDPVENCWVAFRRIYCVAEDELPGKVIGYAV